MSRTFIASAFMAIDIGIFLGWQGGSRWTIWAQKREGKFDWSGCGLAHELLIK
jgi:hypothetical protein